MIICLTLHIKTTQKVIMIVIQLEQDLEMFHDRKAQVQVTMRV